MESKPGRFRKDSRKSNIKSKTKLSNDYENFRFE